MSCTKHQAALMEMCQLLFSCFIFNKFGFWRGGRGLCRSGSGQEQAEGCCECGNESSGFIKCGEFIE